MKIKITADSTCDLSKDLVEKYNIDILPLYIVVDGEAKKDGIEITRQDIFNFVDKEVSKGKKMPTSSAINVDDYINYFTPLSKEYDAVIHINISSELSSCHQNAKLASQEFNNVYVFDSRNLTTGSGHLVLNAAIMAEKGMDANEILENLDIMKDKLDVSFVIDRMDYLQKGGRCSSVAAVAATVLKIKPTIEVKNGKMVVGKKYQGNFNIALKKYIKDKLSDRNDLNLDRVFITHPACTAEIVEMVREEIKKYADFKEILETNAGCTVSTHCGPYTLGILFQTK